MRILPLITAVLVAAALYGGVMKRDEIRAFATSMSTGTAETTPQVEAAEDTDEVFLSATQRPVSVVVKVSIAEIVQSGIALSGKTEAARNVEVRSETSGLVISEPILKGSNVHKGDLLCELDTGTRSASLAEARAKLTEAEIKNVTASKLAERGFSSETAAISSMAALEGVQAMVQQAEKEIERLKILAPFDGLLESDTAELGALMQPGTPCANLISLDPINVVGYVPETDVEKLRVGSLAGARLSTGKEISGAVTFISRAADPLTRTFRVEIKVPNPDNAIRDGLSADILIGLDGASGHLLPQSSLTLNDQGDLGVRTNENNVTAFMPVNILRDTSEGVWVTGLPERVEVIIIGQEYVTAGRSIDVSYQELTQ